MKIKFVLGSVLAAMGLMTATGGYAQTRWQGTDALDPLQLPDDTEVFLYNVGTGRFLIHGGDYGTQGRLFYNDSGKMLVVHRSGNASNPIFSFDTGMTTNKDGDAKWLFCSTGSWDNSDLTLTIVMDGKRGDGNWTLTPVDDGDGTFTYYMSQSRQSTTMWMGAAYGENQNGHDGDPNGELALLSSSFDKAVWSTANPTGTTDYPCGVKNAEAEGLPTGTTTVERSMDDKVPIFNVDTKVTLRDLYKWRIVTKQQLLATMTHFDFSDGLSTNLTYLINDRGFERNDYSFFEGTNGQNGNPGDNGWVAKPFSGMNYTVEGNGRYLYTWGFVTGRSSGAERLQQSEANGGQKTIRDESYMKPIRLKAQFDNGRHSSTYTQGDGFNGKVDAKFGFLEFEGVGTVSTYISVPDNGAGVYRIAAYGFYQNGGNEEDHPAYFFATTQDPNTLSKEDFNDPQKVVMSEKLKVVSDYHKDDKTSVLAAGNDFVYDKTDYLRELQIKISESAEKIYFGVVKFDATRQESSTPGYYYDSDWVGADQFDITYLGTENPIWLDERYTTYEGIDDNAQYKNRAIRLHRTFELGQWNSFVYPMDLTAVQVRNAFGDEVRVAKLVGPGELSGNTGIIDFKTVPLPAEGPAIEKGKFYIIMPQNEPLISSEDDPVEPALGKRTYYNMGNASFRKSDLPTAVTVTECKNEAENVSVYSHATFFNGTNVPEGSYVLGKHKTTGVYNMYYLKSPATIKGFRGWLTETNSSTYGSKKISINGIFDDTTGIVGLTTDNVRHDNIVYDMSGRKVGSTESMERLPKGIYVVNGKKWIVK